MPDHVRTGFSEILGGDDAIQAFAGAAHVATGPLPERWQRGEGQRLLDLRDIRDLAVLDRDWFAPMIADLGSGKLDGASLEFGDGRRFRLARAHRWRLWRRPLQSFVQRPPDNEPE